MIKGRNALPVEEIRKGLQPFFDDKGLRLVLLFGSAASGKTHRRSDIDIAFLYDRPVDILELTNQVIRLLHTDSVDVVDLRRAGPLLKFSVVKNGVLIYEREQGMSNEFYSLAFRMYVDAKKLRNARMLAIRRFVEVRGRA